VFAGVVLSYPDAVSTLVTLVVVAAADVVPAAPLAMLKKVELLAMPLKAAVPLLVVSNAPSFIKK
jgi:hypothetical protein